MVNGKSLLEDLVRGTLNNNTSDDDGNDLSGIDAIIDLAELIAAVLRLLLATTNVLAGFVLIYALRRQSSVPLCHAIAANAVFSASIGLVPSLCFLLHGYNAHDFPLVYWMFRIAIGASFLQYLYTAALAFYWSGLCRHRFEITMIFYLLAIGKTFFGVWEMEIDLVSHLVVYPVTLLPVIVADFMFCFSQAKRNGKNHGLIVANVYAFSFLPFHVVVLLFTILDMEGAGRMLFIYFSVIVSNMIMYLSNCFLMYLLKSDKELRRAFGSVFRARNAKQETPLRKI